MLVTPFRPLERQASDCVPNSFKVRSENLGKSYSAEVWIAEALEAKGLSRITGIDGSAVGC